jgi:methylenetetrahydrofolate reductase (NADPH)
MRDEISPSYSSLIVHPSYSAQKLMTRISIELVPRDREQLQLELCGLQQNFAHIDTINIPDLLRFEMRSWQGCALAKQAGLAHAIPHLRAIDFVADEPFPLFEFVAEHGLTELLVVSGDPPPAGLVRDERERHTAVSLIRHLKTTAPHLSIYAAIDPYRQGIQQEVEYALAKQEAGADGFFTQPFFDVRLMHIFYDQIPHLNIYWGVSPVLTGGSQKYWTTRNRAIFPSTFEPTLAWNQTFGRQALAFAQQTESNIYFMPILADVVSYLQGIF